MNALAACILASLALAACSQPRRPGTPPLHLLLVTCESLRPDRLSCYQHLVPTSAFDSTLEERIEGRAFGLDELARGGVLFERGFATASAPIPSLTALHTGRSPIETGVITGVEALAPGTDTLAELLADHGFATAAFLSDPTAALASALAPGFEHVESATDDAAAFAAARGFLSSRDTGAGQPTFLWIHLAGLAPPWDVELLPTSASHRRARELDGRADGSSAFQERVARGEIVIDARDRAELEARYDERLRATLERLDTFLRDGYDWYTSPVEASETWQRTLFVFAGANGCELGERGTFGAPFSPHEGALRVPLLLRHPDTLTGERVFARIVTLEDVLPTVLDAFAIDAPIAVDGRTLWTLLDDRTSAGFEDRPAIAVLPGPRYSLRADGVRAIWDRWGTGPTAYALHDRRRDPRELLDRSAEAQVATEWTRAAILRWRGERSAWRPPASTARR